MEEETPKDTRERRRTTLRMPPLAREGKGSRKSKTLGEPDVVNREDYEAMELDSRLKLKLAAPCRSKQLAYLAAV